MNIFIGIALLLQNDKENKAYKMHKLFLKFPLFLFAISYYLFQKIFTSFIINLFIILRLYIKKMHVTIFS